MGETKGNSLEVFRGAVEVMLSDEILTREEKRLIVRLADLLNLEDEQPQAVYQAVREGRETPEGGYSLSDEEQLALYDQLFEVALVNDDISKDELAVLAFLKDSFAISDEQQVAIEKRLRAMVEEEYEPKRGEKMFEKLRSFSSTIGDLFESIRTRSGFDEMGDKSE